MSRLYLGIDNGVSGALGLIGGNGELVWHMPVPVTKRGKTTEIDVLELHKELLFLSLDKNVTVVMEGPSKHSKGVLALCSTHECFGCNRSVIAMLGLRTHIVTQPKTWQKEFWATATDTKAESIRIASLLWPGEKFLRTERCKGPDNNITDALLIAEYGRRKGL